MTLKPSEFILNADDSIYHLNLLPHELAPTIITVGDPERVPEVSKHFDTIEYKKEKREFHTHTGTYQGTPITVISTGIGTDNIDIVFNELDALVNIDFKTRTVKKELTSLTLIRIGTSGAIQSDIPVDAFLVSEQAIGMDSLLHWHTHTGINDEGMIARFRESVLNTIPLLPYSASGNVDLVNHFKKLDFQHGITLTNVGFYGPQGRTLRIPTADGDLNSKIESFTYENKRITNLEMETAGIYSMARLLGHRAVSLNAMVANRATGKFSEHPTQTVEKLIKLTLNQLSDLT